MSVLEIWAIATTRNEADIIRANVLHHLNQGIDRFLIPGQRFGRRYRRRALGTGPHLSSRMEAARRTLPSPRAAHPARTRSVREGRGLGDVRGRRRVLVRAREHVAHRAGAVDGGRVARAARQLRAAPRTARHHIGRAAAHDLPSGEPLSNPLYPLPVRLNGVRGVALQVAVAVPAAEA